jgi:hypothetical protein
MIHEKNLKQKISCDTVPLRARTDQGLQGIQKNQESRTLVIGLLLSLFLILQVVVAVDAVAVEAELTIRKTITVELNKRSRVEKLTSRPNFDHCFIFSLKNSAFRLQ